MFECGGGEGLFDVVECFEVIEYFVVFDVWCCIFYFGLWYNIFEGVDDFYWVFF